MKMVGSCTSSPPKKLRRQSQPRPVLTAQSNTLNVPLATLTPVHSSSPATPAAGSDDALEFPPTSPIGMSSPAHVSSPTRTSSPTCTSSPTSAAGHVSSSASSNSRKHARSSAAAQSQPKTSAQPASAPPLKKAKFTDGSDKVPQGHGKASDCEKSVSSKLLLATSNYECQVQGQNPFPDGDSQRRMALSSWEAVCKDSGENIELSDRMLSIVSICLVTAFDADTISL